MVLERMSILGSQVGLNLRLRYTSFVVAIIFEIPPLTVPYDLGSSECGNPGTYSNLLDKGFDIVVIYKMCKINTNPDDDEKLHFATKGS